MEDVRPWSALSGALLIFGVVCTGSCGDLMNRENDSLEPAQSVGATVLGYARFTQCSEDWNPSHTDYRWECPYWDPSTVVIRPYRSWLVASAAFETILKYDYVTGEFLLGVILLMVGLTERPRERY